MAFIDGVYSVSGLGSFGLSAGVIGLLGGPPVIPLDFTLPVAGPVSAELDIVPQVCQEENDNIQLVVNVVDQAGNPVDVRESEETHLVLLKPDGTTLKRAATFLTSGVDGALQYTTVATDLIEAGTYQVQATFVIDSKTQSTRRAKFRVGANIED